jgi:glycosyltransferase involved in cell wall biosynthesis
MRARLVFVEQFYYPEGWGGAELPRDLTTFLAARGFDVEVICGADQYVPAQDKAPDPASLGVRIRRIASIGSGGVRRLRLLRQAWFSLALLPLLLSGRKPQLYLTQTNPPSAVILVGIAARLRRTPLVIVAMDVYPEVVAAYGMVRADGLLWCLLRSVFRWGYRSATRVVALGPVMAERLRAKGVEPARIVTCSNWSTGAAGIIRGDANQLRSEWQLQGCFVLLYSGNLGVGPEFETLLEGIAHARQALPNLRLVVIGRGRRAQEVRALVEALRLTDIVRMADFLPASRLPESLGLADVALVTLRAGFEGLIVPSKVLSYMARGLPILYVGPVSDIDAYLDAGSCGMAVRGGDAVGVQRAVLAMHADPVKLRALGEAGRRYYEQSLAREHGLAHYQAIVQACLAPQRNGA